MREAAAVAAIIDRVGAARGGVDVLAHNALTPRAHYETFIAPHYTTDGQADLVAGGSAIATKLGVPVTVDAADFYLTAP